MVNAGRNWRDLSWPDDWTVTTADGAWSAAAEETLLVTENGIEVLTAQGGPKAYDTTKRRQAWAQAQQAAPPLPQARRRTRGSNCMTLSKGEV